MNRFLLILILTFSFQTLSKADDIRDFEIEGMSVGDSLLDYLNETDIKKKINSYADKGFIYKSKAYYSLTFNGAEIFNLDSYNQIQFDIKDEDNKYIISSISGIKKYQNNIEKCYSQIDSIEIELDILFKNSTENKGNKKKRKHVYDESGESTTTDIYYWLKDKSSVAIVCTDWSNDMIKKHSGWFDHLRLTIHSSEFSNWFKSKAY
jgi:hypothetical protein